MAATAVVDDRSRQASLALRVPIITFSSAVSPTQTTTMPMPVHRHQLQNGQLQQPDQNHYRAQPTFGVCFDVDGVLAKGTIGIPEAPKAMRKLLDSHGQLKVPVSFVTNSLNRAVDRANQLTEILGIHVSPEQLIQAPCPLRMFSGLQDKFCLVVGQGNILEIAADLGFRRMCTVEDVAVAYPLLDMVDHDNRRRISKFGYEEKPLPPVEAIVLMGEPKRWESALQIIVDLLRTNGRPDNGMDQATLKNGHLPVVACNMDLQFKDRAAVPRLGHGAFLVCLEALYKKLTGDDLLYTALVGKPSEITFRFAEHVLTMESKRMGYTEPLRTMYLIGDTPEVDIAGCNLYQKYIDRQRDKQMDIDIEETSSIESHTTGSLLDPSLPECRNVPHDTAFHPQTVERVIPLLVCTGVYKHGEDTEPGQTDSKSYHGHRDFPKNADLDKPAKICSDVDGAIDYILGLENF